MLRQGRLFFRAGRYAEALTVLEAVEHVPESSYWLARCYERLQRFDEAIELYRHLDGSAANLAILNIALTPRGTINQNVDRFPAVRAVDAVFVLFHQFSLVT